MEEGGKKAGKGHPAAVLLGQWRGHHHHTGLCASSSHTISRGTGAVAKPITESYWVPILQLRAGGPHVGVNQFAFP